MVILVTGASGWIGSRLLELLVHELGEPVRALIHNPLDAHRIGALTPDVVVGDVRDRAVVGKALADVTSVFHLAAVIHPRMVKDLYAVNTGGTRVLLDSSLDKGVDRFIYVSSESAVGKTCDSAVATTEENLPRPCNPYGKSKLFAEGLVNRAHELHGLKTTVLRPCWVYGPGHSAQMARLMRLVSSGKIPLFGGGENLMSLSYVDDVVAGLRLVRDSKKAIGQTYFLCHERPYRLIDIYRALAKALGVPFRAVRMPAVLPRLSGLLDSTACKAGVNVMTFRVLAGLGQTIDCSIEKAKQDLGYRPSVTLQQGMDLSVAWSRARGRIW